MVTSDKLQIMREGGREGGRGVGGGKREGATRGRTEERQHTAAALRTARGSERERDGEAEITRRPEQPEERRERRGGSVTLA